jgi:molybdate/tungstate transport system permease protein
MKNKIPITGILGGILVIYYIAPILSILTWGGGEGIISSIRDEVVISAIWTSMTTSFFSVCISGIFGIPLAYVLSRNVFKGKNIILFLVFLPLILPPIVSGMVLLTLFGPESILN